VLVVVLLGDWQGLEQQRADSLTLCDL